jgi:phosphoglycolate phosphatase
MICQGVVFDLDGTLLDTLEDISAAVNRVLAARGFATHNREAYRWFVGDGSAVLIERALPPAYRTPPVIEACLAEFLADYNNHWSNVTRPYQGITDLLHYLQNQTIPIAIVTNKPHQFTGIMVEHYFPDIRFCSTAGYRRGTRKKPDPGQALTAVRTMKRDPARCIFLGDSAVDMQTAVAAGMIPIGAGWGFRPSEELWGAGARYVISHPMELTPWIESTSSQLHSPS